MITFDHVTKRYKDGTLAVEDLIVILRNRRDHGLGRLVGVR